MQTALLANKSKVAPLKAASEQYKTRQTQFEQSIQNPITLESKHPVAILIIMDLHHRLAHSVSYNTRMTATQEEKSHDWKVNTRK